AARGPGPRADPRATPRRMRRAHGGTGPRQRRSGHGPALRQRRASRPRRHRGHARQPRVPLRAQHRAHGRRPDRGGVAPQRRYLAVRTGPSVSEGGPRMKRFVMPAIGVVAALWAAYSVARTRPERERTEPAAPPPVADFPRTVAAVGLVEASTENISVGTPLAGGATGVVVAGGPAVRGGDRLFEIDTRHLRAELAARREAVTVAGARVGVAEARLADLQHQYDFAEHVTDRRAISAEELSRRRSAMETARAELEEARAQGASAGAAAQSTAVEIDRSTVRAPIDAEVLQVKVRVGEFAPAGVASEPLVLLGRSKPLHVRVDVDEHEGWRVRPGAAAIAHLRGNALLTTPLT